MDADPSEAFFPDGDVDLYAVLGVDSDTSQQSIKKAYRKMALQYHPDKVLPSKAAQPNHDGVEASDPAADASLRFQQIGFAYAVLSSETRRARYDATGRTDEIPFGDGDGTFDWNEYFQTLWTGEVTGATLDEFKRNYQSSDEERDDVLQAYRETGGSLEQILQSVPCAEVLTDENRFVKIVENAIEEGVLERSAAWSRSMSDTAGRERMRRRAQQEASEAEAYARELGVWEDLFGQKGKNRTGNNDSNVNHTDADDDVSPKRSSKKRKPMASHSTQGEAEEVVYDTNEHANTKANQTTSRKRNKSDAVRRKPRSGGRSAGDEDEDDVSGLAALIAQRQQNRESAFDQMIARVEAGSSASTTPRKKKKTKRT